MKFNIREIIKKYEYDPNSVKKNYDGKTDIYLAKVSYRYAYVRRILCIILCLVAIALVLSGNISYNKIYYLTKDISLAASYVNSVHDTVTYNVGDSQSFVAYRSGIAVASRQGFSIFSASGRELFSSTHEYGNPTLVTSDKYVLLYDVGGKQFSLYNSFSKIKETVLDYPIYGACISDNGSHAVITTSDSYESVVVVYKQNGTRIDYNFKKGRVIAVSLSQNGGQLAVALASSNINEMKTEIRLYKVGNSSYRSAALTYSGTPYDIKILNNGNTVAVGAYGVNVFNSSLGIITEYLTETEIYAYEIGEYNIAVAHSSLDGRRSEAIIFNKRGRAEKTITFDERIIDLTLYRGYLFTQVMGGFVRTNISLNISQKIEMAANTFKIIPSDKNTLIICDSSYAKYLNFK